MKHAVIIGGGIAGLSAAYYALKKAAERGIGLKVTLLESGACWGGKLVSERIACDGGRFIVEGGADSFLAGKPQAVGLCRELGLGECLQPTIPNRRSTYILHDGRLLPVPGGLSMLIPTDPGSVLASRLLSWPQKARMGLDFFLPARTADGDESLGAFISRRLGRGAYENLVEPLMSGIYAGDGDALSLQSTFPALRALELEHGSLARGALAVRQKTGAAGRSAFLTPEGGLGQMVEALVARLAADGAQLRLHAPALFITRNPSGYHVELGDGSSLEADSVVLAAPAHAGATLLAALDPGLSAELGAIPYASTATVSLAYRLSDLPRPLDGYGYVIPRREGRPALACTWTSSKFAGRAPEGYALLRVFVGRAGQELPSPGGRWAGGEGEMQAIAREELALTLGISAEPLFSRVFLWEKAMPQYNLGHPERLGRIEAALQKYPGLALAGAGYKGVGIPDCIRSGELAAEKILEHG